MDCREIERALVAGRAATGPVAEAHLAECPACRYLVGEGAPIAAALAGADVGSPSGFAGLEVAVLDAVRDDRGTMGRLRQTRRPIRLLLVAALVGLELLFIYSYVRRSDWSAYPSWRMALIVVSYAAGAMALGWIALRPVYLPSLSTRVEWTLLGISLGIPLLFSLLPAEATAPNPLFNYPRFTFRCFAYGACLALPVILAARLLDRGGGLALGAAAAAVLAGAYAGLMGLQVECPINYPLHLLTGHATVPLGLLLGTWLVRKS